MKELLTSREAAALLGVSATSIKRWSDEGLLACVKTAGHHRRFERAVVERFRVDPAGGGAVEARDVELQEWIELLVGSDDLHAVEARLLEERALHGSWWRVAAALAPLLTEIGRRWADGQLSVVDEHLASERLARALLQVCERLPASSRAPAALLATAEGDEHTLGLSLVELCLREVGWRTMWTGRRTPVDELIASIERALPPVQLVAVSASEWSSNRRTMAAQAHKLEAACRKADVALIVGGDGAWPQRLGWGVALRSFEALHLYARERLHHAR
ncbi:MAG: helix-turn-helix domain-containing protein [Polyangia bacterium]